MELCFITPINYVTRGMNNSIKYNNLGYITPSYIKEYIIEMLHIIY